MVFVRGVYRRLDQVSLEPLRQYAPTWADTGTPICLGCGNRSQLQLVAQLHPPSVPLRDFGKPPTSNRKSLMRLRF
jgi:hypothetical protein